MTALGDRRITTGDGPGRSPGAAQAWRAAQRREAEALVRVLQRVAEQFPELEGGEILDAVRGNYADGPAIDDPDRATTRPTTRATTAAATGRYFRA